MVYGAPYPWYIDPLPMVSWPPYHWYIDPPTHDILTPYPWYFDPLSMLCWPISWLEMRGVKLPYRGGGQDTIWHRSFLHSWPNTGLVIRLTRRVPLVEQEQLTFPEHPSSVPVFSGFCVTRSLVLCVCFVDHCLSFFAIVLSVLRFTDSFYPFRLWYLETLKKSCYSFPDRLLC